MLKFYHLKKYFCLVIVYLYKQTYKTYSSSNHFLKDNFKKIANIRLSNKVSYRIPFLHYIKITQAYIIKRN